MTLRYSVLWVDDSPDWVKPIRNTIETYLREKFLDPDITLLTSGNDVGDIMSRKTIDLLILDRGLPGKNGDDIIRDVRSHGEITEIVFYSQADGQHQALIGWDGITFSHREDAERSIKDSVNSFVRRNNNISVMRGVIIAEAIDVENKLTDIIKKLFSDKYDLFKIKILDKAWLDFAKKAMFVQSCLNDRVKYEQGRQSQNKKLINELSGCSETLKDIFKEVIDQRNILAHSDKESDSNGHLVLKGLNKSTEKIVFDNAWKNSIRENMRKHKENLKKIYDLI